MKKELNLLGLYLKLETLADSLQTDIFIEDTRELMDWLWLMLSPEDHEFLDSRGRIPDVR